MQPTITKIPYKPRKWAWKLHNTIKRWIVIVNHRRCGKTTAVLNHIQRDCLRYPNTQYAYVAVTYKQAKRVAWDMLKNIAYPTGAKPNEADLVMIYPNGSKLMLLGSENVDGLRGLALWGGGQDEASQQPSNLFSEVISKALADHLGYWIWLGTPKGKNEFHRTYQNGLEHIKDWEVIFRTIDDTLKEEEGETVDNLRIALEDDKRLVEQGQMTQEEFDQEWYCSFDAAIKGAYYAKQISKARKDGRLGKYPADLKEKVYTVSDLGIGTQFATGFFQVVGKEIHMVDLWEGTEKDGLPEWKDMLTKKGYTYGKHFAPHDIRQTEFTTGKTRIDTAKTLGVKFDIIPSMSVDDGIEAGRLAFNRLWVNEEKCTYFIDAISQYCQEWDDARGMFKDKPYKNWTSHMADMWRYAAIVEKYMSDPVYDNFEQPEYEAPGQEDIILPEKQIKNPMENKLHRKDVDFYEQPTYEQPTYE